MDRYGNTFPMFPNVIEHVKTSINHQANKHSYSIAHINRVLGIDDEEKESHEHNCQRQVIRSGHAIFHADSSLTHIYFVVSGTVKVQFEHEGRLLISDFASAGDVLGLDGITTSFHVNTAIALSDVVLLGLPYSAFISHSQKCVEFNEVIVKRIGAALTRTTRHMGIMARGHAEEKIAFMLISLAIKSGSENRPAREITLGISRGEIALHLGLAYETTVRILGAFRSQKIISLERRKITIENHMALQNLCSAYAKRSRGSHDHKKEPRG